MLLYCCYDDYHHLLSAARHLLYNTAFLLPARYLNYSYRLLPPATATTATTTATQTTATATSTSSAITRTSTPKSTKLVEVYTEKQSILVRSCGFAQ